MHIDEMMRKAEPTEYDRKLMAARAAHYLDILGLQVNEASGEIEAKPMTSMPIPAQQNVRYAGMPSRSRRRR